MNRTLLSIITIASLILGNTSQIFAGNILTTTLAVTSIAAQVAGPLRKNQALTPNTPARNNNLSQPEITTPQTILARAIKSYNDQDICTAPCKANDSILHIKPVLDILTQKTFWRLYLVERNQKINPADQTLLTLPIAVEPSKNDTVASFSTTLETEADRLVKVYALQVNDLITSKINPFAFFERR